MNTVTGVIFVLGIFCCALFFIVWRVNSFLKRRDAQREQLETALRESQLRFHALALSSQDAIVSTDDTGIIIYCNHAAQTMFGYAVDEITGKPLNLILPEHHRGTHTTGIEAMRTLAIPGEIGKSVCLQGLRKDGGEFPLALSPTSWQTKQGVFYHVMLRDMTEHNHTKSEIARLASFPEANPTPVVEVNSSGIVTYVNPAARSQFPDMKVGSTEHPLLMGLIGLIQNANQSSATRVITFSDSVYEQHVYVNSNVMRIRITNVTERLRAEESLKKSRSELVVAQKIAHLGSWEWDFVSDSINWSDELYRVYALQPQSLVITYATLLSYAHPDDRGSIMEVVSAALDDYSQFSIDHRIIRADGVTRIVHLSGEIILDAEGKTCRMLGTTQDITERVRTEQELRLLQNITLAISGAQDLHAALAIVLQKVCESTGWILGQAWLPDADGTYLECSPAWFSGMDGLEEIRSVSHQSKFISGQGLPGRVWAGKAPIWILDVTHDTNFPRASAAAAAGLKAAFGIPVLSGDEVVAILEFFVREPRAEDERLAQLMSAIAVHLGMVIQRKRSEERLNYMAHHDALTNLPNRVLLQDRLQNILIDADRHDRLAAVLFLDIDHFKTINDTLGHEMGDALLKAVAKRLQECVRAGDTVARLGGDEFSVVLAEVRHVDDVARVVKKILDTVADPYQITGKELFVTTSIGITLFPFDENTPDGLLKNADVAMYRAKEAGRNTYCYYTAEMNTRAHQRLRIETNLRHALERDELFLHYQPQIDLKNGHLVGVEALIRWRHPELGQISPTEFIPAAEETGLIGPIGEWVLHTACAQNKAWQAAGLAPMQVAVNVSGWQLKRQNLVGLVTRILKETQLAPEYLGLELTESMLIDNVAQTVSMLDELHALGIRFSIDDFGTGYSSLSYLRRFSIDTLKMDQSFVHGIPANGEDAAIAQAIIVMAHSLGMKTLAEGVETIEQMAFMQAHGCDIVQGYYLSVPLSADAVVQYLLSRPRACG